MVDSKELTIPKTKNSIFDRSNKRMIRLVSADKHSADELKHFGVLGMKWGVQKDRDKGESNGSTSKKPSYYERSKNDYLSRGFSKADAELLAKRKATIRTAALIAGGVTLAVGAAFVARHYMIETKDINLKAGAKTFHIDRDVVKDLDPTKSFYVTVGQADRKAYQWRLANPKQVERIERTFAVTKDIKIPSPKKSKALYDEFIKDSNAKQLTKEAFSKFGVQSVTHDQFLTLGPYFSKGDSWHLKTGNNEAGEKLWNSYKDFLMNKGYQGVLDANDRAKEHGFNVERPTILFEAAQSLKEVSRQSLGTKDSGWKAMLPTIREAGSLKTAAYAAAAASIASVNISDGTQSVESYRKVYPDSKKSNSEIIKAMKNDYDLSYRVYSKVSK